MKINRALLISSVPTTNIKPCIRSLYIYTSFLKHTACNNSCGNIDNPPQIPPATICILLLGIYFMPISKNGITNTIIIKTHPKFAISEYFFISFGSLNGIALGLCSLYGRLFRLHYICLHNEKSYYSFLRKLQSFCSLQTAIHFPHFNIKLNQVKSPILNHSTPPDTKCHKSAQLAYKHSQCLYGFSKLQ